MLGLLAGVAVFLSFDRHLWWLAIVGIALLINQLADQSLRVRLRVTCGFAIGFWLPLLSWMRVLGLDAWLLLSLLGIIPWLAIAFVGLDSPKTREYVVFAAAIVVMEQIRTVVPWGGFPWGHLAYSQLDGPFVQLARVGGQALVTATVILSAAALREMLLNRRLLPIAGIGGLVAICSFIPAAATSGVIQVAAVQGNVPRTSGSDITRAQAVFDNHVKQTLTFVEQVQSGTQKQPALIVWPENSADRDPLHNQVLAQRITAVAQQAQTPMLIGALVYDEPGRGPTNSALLWRPDGTISDRYNKNHVVAFGEYLPFRSVLAKYVSRFEQVPWDFKAGTKPGVMRLSAATFGTVICFEVAYDDVISKTINQGAQFLAVQSNNATYAHTRQPDQQLSITRFRAVEHQRAIVVATTTGASALISPSGEVLSVSQNLTAQTLAGELPLVDTRQLVDRIGNLPVYLAMFLLLGNLIQTRFRRSATVGLTT